MIRAVFLPLLFASLLTAPGTIAAQPAASKAPTSPDDPEAAILYNDGGGFMATGPKSWVLDREVGKQIGTCCVFYPKGSTWDNADAVMYPSIVTKKSGRQTLKEFMDADLSEFRAQSPGMTFEDAPDIALKDSRKAVVRYFRGVNKGSTEVVAYVDEPKMIALFVLSAKSPKALDATLPAYREFVGSYFFMNVKIQDDKSPPAGRNKK